MIMINNSPELQQLVFLLKKCNKSQTHMNELCETFSLIRHAARTIKNKQLHHISGLIHDVLLLPPISKVNEQQINVLIDIVENYLYSEFDLSLVSKTRKLLLESGFNLNPNLPLTKQEIVDSSLELEVDALACLKVQRKEWANQEFLNLMNSSDEPEDSFLSVSSLSKK